MLPHCAHMPSHPYSRPPPCSYQKFNAVARKLHVRLQQLGSTPLLDRALADEQSDQGIEGDYDAWCKQALPLLEAACPLPPGALTG